MKRTLALLAFLALAACTHTSSNTTTQKKPPTANPSAAPGSTAAMPAPTSACPPPRATPEDDELPAGTTFGDLIRDLHRARSSPCIRLIGAVAKTTKDAATSPVTVVGERRPSSCDPDEGRPTAPIDPKSSYDDTCAGTNGRHASRGMLGVVGVIDLRSKALGASFTLSVRGGFQDSLSDGKNDKACRGGDGGRQLRRDVLDGDAVRRGHDRLERQLRDRARLRVRGQRGPGVVRRRRRPRPVEQG